MVREWHALAGCTPREWIRSQLQLNLDDVAAAERIFAQLADGGRVTVPLQQTFWAQRFGAVVDRFGIPWGINCAAREV